jgi:hypothetical protein
MIFLNSLKIALQLIWQMIIATFGRDYRESDHY